MTRQISFSAHERRLLPKFREKINKAESSEDVKKVFTHTVEELLNGVLDRTVRVGAKDIALVPNSEPPYQVSEGLRTHQLLKFYWSESDLPHVIQRLAESAMRRHKRLQKHPERTELKIRM